MLERSAIVLAGGRSTRMKGDKGLRRLGGEPLVSHVVRRISGIVDEVLVIVGSEEQRREYAKQLDEDTKLIIDLFEAGSPLIGALTGFKHAGGLYALVAGCDTPFILPDAVSMLFEGGDGYDGATFHWPNGWVEPLMSVYRVEPSLKLALEAYSRGELRLRTVLRDLPRLRLIPVDDLRRLDPELLTLFDVDTDDALSQAETILSKMRSSAQSV